ncbi:MAG TPA: hypothetical protein VKU40_02950, partial [Thermoanaerobaculia bacterium]|nr:hypothetical protein [Thermoanaerobaculia bacterium]
MRYLLSFFACFSFCLTLFVAAPASADLPQRQTRFDQPSCAAKTQIDIDADEPLFMGPCSVQMECADESVISCNGNNSCSTQGNCVVCDGVQEECCAGATCCDECFDGYLLCLNNCGGRPCFTCEPSYEFCTSQCTGG